MNFVLDFLAQLFEKKIENSTINTYRPALSDYHDKIDNQSAGKHPKVCNLMTGVFNRNPPKPRYVFFWDIEQVLTFIKAKSNKVGSFAFSPQQINVMKFVILILNLWLEHQVISSFSLPKLQKVRGKGNLHHVMEFHKYSDDKKLYVVACIDEYLRGSAPCIQSQNQLLLSHLKRI